jgi:uncharacterized membrane protein required for colicin V production
MNLNLNSLPFNAFDVALVVILGLGIFAGRKHGMSEELMGLIKWLAVAIGCAFIYQPAGEWLANSSPFSLLSSYLMVYITGALLVLGAFALVKHRLGGKLIGSDIFGRSEFYLGMGAGLVRFACILVAGLALLNARYFSSQEVLAMEHFQDDVYGSNYFPTLHTAQAVVFEKSLFGPYIRENLGFLLIHPTPPQDKQYHQKEVALP